MFPNVYFAFGYFPDAYWPEVETTTPTTTTTSNAFPVVSMFGGGGRRKHDPSISVARPVVPNKPKLPTKVIHEQPFQEELEEALVILSMML